MAWSQATERLSVDSAGVEGNNASTAPSNSSDGRYVAFESQADNLVAGDVLGFIDIFVRDRQTSTTTRVSVDSGGAEGSGDSNSPSISGDGRHVAFESNANDLVAVDINPLSDLFVRDLLGVTTTLVSVDSAGNQDPIPSSSSSPSLSSNGRYVAFQSDADLVVTDTNGLTDIYVHDRDADGDGIYDEAGAISTVRVSVRSDGTEADRASVAPSISGDGRYVAFESFATNLVAGDLNGLFDVFVHDRDADGDGIYDEAGAISTVRVSVRSDGTEADQASAAPSISADGRYVAFESLSTNLVAGDTNGKVDIFVHDRDADGNGTYDEPGAISTVRVSVDLAGVQGNGDSNSPSISADGSSVTFQSDADNLVVGNTLGFPDIFVDDLQAAAGGGGGGGSSSGGGGCFIATAADGSGMAGEVK